jgi:hypothetical protein
MEAREYTARCVDELRQNDPARFEDAYLNPWRALRVRRMPAVIVSAVGVAVFYAMKPDQPLQVVWYLCGGTLFGVLGVVMACTRGFAKKSLAFILCTLVVFTGGTLLFRNPMPGQFLLLMVGLFATLAVLRPGRGR